RTVPQHRPIYNKGLTLNGIRDVSDRGSVAASGSHAGPERPSRFLPVLDRPLLHRSVLERSEHLSTAAWRQVRSEPHAGGHTGRVDGVLGVGHAAGLWVPVGPISYTPVFGARACRGGNFYLNPRAGSGVWLAGGDGALERSRHCILPSASFGAGDGRNGR